MLIFLPATSKQHQVARALLQWPQNCFSCLKRIGMHLGKEQSSLCYLPGRCFRMGSANPNTKAETGTKKCKKKVKITNLKNTEWEGAQGNRSLHPWVPQKTAVSFASTVLTPPVLRALVMDHLPTSFESSSRQKGQKRSMQCDGKGCLG